jgi:carbonic anhydrase/acetyltransferase-like protein (isoleucine patch superfamily)
MLEAGVSVVESLDDVSDRGRLLVREDVTLTRAAVEDMVARGLEGDRDFAWRADGRTGAFARELALGDEGPWLVWLKAGGDADPARIAAAEFVEFDSAERMLEMPVPRAQFGADVLELPLSDRVVLPTGHWLQLLWANLLAMPPFLWRQLAGRNVVEVGWRLAGAVVRAGSLDPRTVGARLGRRGTGCRVHPSAVVEGCWLGDGVEIGAGAVVRACILSDGVAVEDLAMVEGCVLSAGSRVQRCAMVKYSVLGERSSAGGIQQLAVLDRDAATKLTSTLMDQAFGGQGVQVRIGERLVRAPLGLAGVCVGAGAVVGAGVRVAPGRAIPAGVEIVSPPETVVRRIPEGISGRVAVRDGGLEPL